MNATKVDTQFTNAKGAASRAAPVVIANLISAAPALKIVRPTNVTAYVAGQCVGVADPTTPANAGSAVLKFPQVGGKGGLVRVVGADLMIYLAALPAGMAAFDLHLYNGAPDARLDGAAWDLASQNDRDRYCGKVTLPAPTDVGSTLYSEILNLARTIKLQDGSEDLYGILVTTAGYTPAAGTTYQVRPHVDARS
jgi:hypothetical protein